MRIFVISALLLAICGSVLYSAKYSFDSRNDELAQLESDIKLARQKAAILNAEWSYLSRPERVLSLSSNLLSMQPISTDRILPLEAIPFRQSAAQPDKLPGKLIEAE